MKKTLTRILLATACLYQLPATAQNTLDKIHIGVIGGLHNTSTSYSNLDKSIFGSPSSAMGGHLGIYGEFDVSDNISLRPQLSFLSRKINIENVAYAKFILPSGFSVNSPVDYTAKAQYTDLRVPVIYNFGSQGGIRPYLYLSPTFGMVRGGEISLAGSGVGYNVDVSKANMADFYFALSPGVGVKFPVGGVTLGIEASYEFGLTDTYGSKEKDGKAVARTLFPIYHIDGTRKFSGFEVSAHVSVPLSIFGGSRRQKVKQSSRYTQQVTQAPQRVNSQRLADCYTLDEVLRMANQGKSVKGVTICAINQINFATNKATINSKSFSYLNKLAQLAKKTGVKIEIRGHTDSQGSEEYNMELSRKRAEAVYKYLISKGVEKSRLSYKYYGESKPIDTNDTEKGRRNNRRVEFKLK